MPWPLLALLAGLTGGVQGYQEGKQRRQESERAQKWADTDMLLKLAQTSVPLDPVVKQLGMGEKAPDWAKELQTATQSANKQGQMASFVTAVPKILNELNLGPNDTATADKVISALVPDANMARQISDMVTQETKQSAVKAEGAEPGQMAGVGQGVAPLNAPPISYQPPPVRTLRTANAKPDIKTLKEGESLISVTHDAQGNIVAQPIAAGDKKAVKRTETEWLALAAQGDEQARTVVNEIERHKKSTVKEGQEPSSIREFETIYGISPLKRGSPEYQKSFEHFKTLGPQAYGAARMNIMLQTPMEVYDPTTSSVYMTTKGEIVRNPGKFARGEMGYKVGVKDSIFNEIQSSSTIMRDALSNLHSDFNAVQRAQFSKVLADETGTAWNNFIGGSVGRTLTKDQVDYVTAVNNLKESAFALRGVQGAGQGSDMLRAAIGKLVPGGTTPTKAFASRSLDLFDNQVQKLKEGLPGLGKGNARPPQSNVPTNAPVKQGKAVVERRKTVSGKTLVKYSDGTIGEEK